MARTRTGSTVACVVAHTLTSAVASFLPLLRPWPLRRCTQIASDSHPAVGDLTGPLGLRSWGLQIGMFGFHGEESFMPERGRPHDAVTAVMQFGAVTTTAVKDCMEIWITAQQYGSASFRFIGICGAVQAARVRPRGFIPTGSTGMSHLHRCLYPPPTLLATGAGSQNTAIRGDPEHRGTSSVLRGVAQRDGGVKLRGHKVLHRSRLLCRQHAGDVS